MTRRVILPDLFQLYKLTRICQLHLFRDGIKTACYTQRAFIYGSPTFDLHRVLLSRVFLLNDEKSTYVSVGFYPAHNYQPLVEFGGTRIQPLFLPADCVTIVVERLPSLVEVMCRNEHFVWSSKDKDFKMHSTKVYRTSRITRNKQGISLKLRTLQYILHIIMNQLSMYTEALGDVHAYVNTTITSCNYIEPTPSASKSINYRQVFDELKSPVY